MTELRRNGHLVHGRNSY